ncbi:MAG: DUF4157 domain-containing protein [Bacteroidota bacterium]
MPTHAEKNQEEKNRSIANAVSQAKNNLNPTFPFKDNRPEATQIRKLQEMADEYTKKNAMPLVDNRPEAVQMKRWQELANNSPRNQHLAQLQKKVNEYAEKHALPIQKKLDPEPSQRAESDPGQRKNKTGMSDTLKTGLEHLSGMSLDDIKVHYNSKKPAQLHAHAYAQGTNIHLAPGQEKHLPHEAWHVIQQKQGRVKPTMQMRGGVNVNDDKELEKEAEVMGAKALQMKANGSSNQLKTVTNTSHGSTIQCLTDAEIEEKYNAEMKSMSGPQKKVIKDIVKIDGWKAFRGGHVVVDGKTLFLRWRTFGKKTDPGKATARGKGILAGSLGSSHYPNESADQYEIRLPNHWFGNNWGTVLFGTRSNPNPNNERQTWFQVEGHSGTLGESKIRFFTDVLMHGADFLQHKQYGLSLLGAQVVNVGPFGTDSASEKTNTERSH